MQLYELIQEFFPAPSLLGYGKKVCHTPRQYATDTYTDPSGQIIADNFQTEEGFSLAGGIKDASYVPPPRSPSISRACSPPSPADTSENSGKTVPSRSRSLISRINT